MQSKFMKVLKYTMHDSVAYELYHYNEECI